MAFLPVKSYPISTFFVDSSGNARDNFVQGFELTGLDFLGLAFGLYGVSSGLPITDQEPDTDAVPQATPQALDTVSYGYLYNPAASQWDRARGNHTATVLASAERTATVNSADQVNHNARGVHITVNVSAYPAAASITPKIEGKDPVSGTYYTILEGVAMTATGIQILKVYPGIGEIANGAASDILPRDWRVTVTHADADAVTYSVGALLDV